MSDPISMVLHLMPADEWRQLPDGEPVTSPSLATEGFVHCTGTPEVLLQVANAFYASSPGDYVVLHVDVTKLTSDCVWEEPAPVHGHVGPAFAPSFPHVYGPIDRDAVLAVQTVVRDGTGRFTGYGELGPSI